MKSFKYIIEFRSLSGHVKSFTVYAACTGNAIAQGWSMLTDTLPSTDGWALKSAISV